MNLPQAVKDNIRSKKVVQNIEPELWARSISSVPQPCRTEDIAPLFEKDSVSFTFLDGIHLKIDSKKWKCCITTNYTW